MTVPLSELELLSLCCHEDLTAPQQERVAPRLQDGSDWESLLRLARHHGVLPLLHQHLKMQEWRGVPAERAAAIKASYRAHLIRNLEMVKQLFQLLDLLARHSVRALPVKGPVLAAQVFGDIGLRAFADLDLVIAPGDLWQCCCLLRNAGFVPEVELDQHTAGLFSSQETALGFRFPGKDLVVELQWNFLPRCFDQRYDFDELWDRRKPVTMENREVTALSDNDTMRHLLLHGFKHGWDRLCLVSDATHAAATLHAGWDRIVTDDLAGTMISSGLLLIDELVAGVIPGEILARAKDDSAAQRLATRFGKQLLARSPEARSILSLGTVYVTGQKGIVRKMTFLGRMIFGVTTEDWKRWRFHRALWRYQILRPWRLLADHLLRPRA